MKLAKKPTATETRKPRGNVPQPDKKSVLLLVHLQNDFCPDGTLAVTGGDEVIPVANECVRLFASQVIPIIATRDWHPANHCSFKEQGGPWPIHCVQGSRGAQFHSNLHLPPGTMIISGATSPEREAYSGFEGTSLQERLEDLGAETLYVLGLATDYCVKQTVLDACRSGFRVVLIEDGTRGVEVNPGDSQQALKEMYEAGAIRASSLDLGIESIPR